MTELRQILPPEILFAEKIIKNTYGDTVSVVDKTKTLLKFGENNDLGTTEETVWLAGGIEPYATGNDINTLVSDNAADNQSVIIEGHTVSGGNLTFVVQTAILNGTTPVTLSTPLFRASRIINDSNTNFVGVITVRAGVGGTIHLQTGVDNQSLKCATSLSSQDYWIITEITVGVNRTQTRSVEFKLQVREYGKVFRTIFPAASSSDGATVPIPVNPPIIVKKNSDIRMNAISSGNATQVFSTINGYLAKIVT